MTRWFAARPDVPDINPGDLILVRNDEERALINAGIDCYAAELKAALQAEFGPDCSPLPPSDHAACWTALRSEVQQYRDAHTKRAEDLRDEGRDPASALFLAAELGWVLALMDRMEGE